ncbi:right-handed parallel beta-helix repeat-containing protein [Xanthomarina sp. GH4-25]|uniref:right-handed parallel beta-helix repeat-containing protein n=1 Tax=Xanthomarina sp. GH4-25 TaxID=3349335 RepID=UPI0038783212
MKKIYLSSLIFFVILFGYSQKEFHVFPESHSMTPGKPSGNGSMNQPWDLQTALNQSSDSVNGDDIIWLHEGVYNGRYYSKLNSTISNKYITVSSFLNEWAVLNGNIISNQTAVLTVTGSGVIYKNFEITWLGEFSRNSKDASFQKSDGVSHLNGKDCKFLNLMIHNNPGSGFGSWKRTSNAIIENCIIYNNGFMTSRRGSGVGMYVQNESDEERLIKNNVIFNNYYKGIEVWSASTHSKVAIVKNVTLDNNVIFNSGLISGSFKDNLIIATDDVLGINIAKNITVSNNIFYHNTTLSKAIENSDAPSLTLGFNEKSPIENITINNNIIIGRKDALRVLSAKSLTFKNNMVYSGYARFFKPVLKHINNKSWEFENNTYYTRNSKPIRIQGEIDYSIQQWQAIYGLGRHSQWKYFKEFDADQVPKITKINTQENTYRVVLFNKDLEDVMVDFSEYNLPENSNYIIKDVENYKHILDSGTLAETSKIKIPMNVTRDKMKSYNNFGVYDIEFKKNETIETKDFLERFLNWLGI